MWGNLVGAIKSFESSLDEAVGVEDNGKSSGDTKPASAAVSSSATGGHASTGNLASVQQMSDANIMTPARASKSGDSSPNKSASSKSAIGVRSAQSAGNLSRVSSTAGARAGAAAATVVAQQPVATPGVTPAKEVAMSPRTPANPAARGGSGSDDNTSTSRLTSSPKPTQLKAGVKMKQPEAKSQGAETPESAATSTITAGNSKSTGPTDTQLRDMKLECEGKIAELKNAHTAALNAAQQAHDDEILRKQKAHKDEREAAAAKHDASLRSMRGESEAVVGSLRRESETKDKRIAELEEQLVAVNKLVESLELRHKKAAAKASDANASAASSKEMETANADLQQRLDKQNIELLQLKAEVGRLHEAAAAAKEVTPPEPATNAFEESNRNLQAQLDQLQSEFKALEESKATLTAEYAACREVVHERERSMENTSGMLAEMTRANEDLSAKVEAAAATIAAREVTIKGLESQLEMANDTIAALKATTSSSKSAASEADTLRKQVARLHEDVAEREGKLAMFAREGEMLSKKQSEMEKAVRKAKGEVKEKETEIVKLREAKDELTRVVEQTQEVMRKHEVDANSSNKSVVAFQTVNNNLQDKIYKLESEVLTYREEVATQKRALEASWSEVTELKRAQSDLRAEKEDLLKQLGKGSDRVAEVERVKRDAEQREAILRATNDQLQDSLQRQGSEAEVREERLRSEITELRQRWQEAVRTRETLASELSSATSPLLRQIASSQESLRLKTEQYNTMESALSEKVMRLEAANETFERRKANLETEVEEAKQHNDALRSRLQSLLVASSEMETVVERYRSLESSQTERVKELEAKLAYESAQVASLSATVKEMEAKCKTDLQDAHEEREFAARKDKSIINELMFKVQQYEQQAGSDLQHNLSGAVGVATPRAGESSGRSSASRHDEAASRARNNAENMAELLSAPASSSSPSDRKDGGQLPESLPNGAFSFAAAERNATNSVRQSNAERNYQRQIQQLEVAHAALVEELTYVSSRNTELEEFYNKHGSVVVELEQTMAQNDALLTLLGEKSEELEAIQQDLQDVKSLYRSQLDELLAFKLTHPSGAGDAAPAAPEVSSNVESSTGQ